MKDQNNNENSVNHIAFIMDGNRRWAKTRNLPEIFGHREGSKKILEMVNFAINLKIKYLTFYTFSTENWNRDKKSIDELFNLMNEYIDKEGDGIRKDERIKFSVIGNIEKLPENLYKKIVDLQIYCSKKISTEIDLIFAINYGSRSEIVNAVNEIIATGEKNITEEKFEYFLSTYKIPDPDILIRTGGMMRISNFLLWQLSYSELFFTNTLWPDFNEKELKKILSDYYFRVRNYGR